MSYPPITLETDYLLSANAPPTESLKRLEKKIEEFWLGNYDHDVLKSISELMHEIEGACCNRYESLERDSRKRMDIGDFAETLGAINELRGGWGWLYRFPALLLTVAIASLCIPVANSLEDVIVKHPILGGFPPAISAAAGCIGIQNTAIVVRALSVKVFKTSRLYAFARYCLISLSLSFGAAVLEAIVAWIVVSVTKAEANNNPPWSYELFFKDVPIVIFFAMLITGALAGIIGAGIPLLVAKVSELINKRLDPAHWVGPIETVVQELSSAALTFWIAAQFVFKQDI